MTVTEVFVSLTSLCLCPGSLVHTLLSRAELVWAESSPPLNTASLPRYTFTLAHVARLFSWINPQRKQLRGVDILHPLSHQTYVPLIKSLKLSWNSKETEASAGKETWDTEQGPHNDDIFKHFFLSLSLFFFTVEKKPCGFSDDNKLKQEVAL